MDINVIIGGVVTALTIVFIIAPAVLGLLFGYSADTYMGQVKAGLGLIGLILGLIVFVLVVVITIGFLTGNFDVVSDMINKVGM
ncbi:hypothetical protein KASIA_p022 [Shewanella phage vB_SspS_KASIA]|nr:hypothetical protein KASIA_p022 [Shewanella phage vB_SspS_KASIA]